MIINLSSDGQPYTIQPWYLNFRRMISSTVCSFQTFLWKESCHDTALVKCQIESSFVPIQDVALKINLKRWTIEKGGERGSEKSMLMVRHDDDDDKVLHLRDDIDRLYEARKEVGSGLANIKHFVHTSIQRLTIYLGRNWHKVLLFRRGGGRTPTALLANAGHRITKCNME